MNNSVDAINVYVESTNNPICFKFVLNFLLLEDTFKVYHRNSANVEENKLVYELFNFYPDIEEFFIMSNFISVSFTQFWNYTDNYLESIKVKIADFFVLNNKNFNNEQFIENLKTIKTVIDEYINPAVEMEGGHFEVYGYSLINRLLILQPFGSSKNNLSLNIDLQQIKRIVENVSKVDLTEVIATNQYA